MSIRNCVCTWKLGKQGIDGSHMKCRNEVSQFGKKGYKQVWKRKISVLLVLQLTEYPTEKAVGEAQRKAAPTALPTALPLRQERIVAIPKSVHAGAHPAEFQCE